MANNVTLQTLRFNFRPENITYDESKYTFDNTKIKIAKVGTFTPFLDLRFFDLVDTRVVKADNGDLYEGRQYIGKDVDTMATYEGKNIIVIYKQGGGKEDPNTTRTRFKFGPFSNVTVCRNGDKDSNNRQMVKIKNFRDKDGNQTNFDFFYHSECADDGFNTLDDFYLNQGGVFPPVLLPVLYFAPNDFVAIPTITNFATFNKTQTDNTTVVQYPPNQNSAPYDGFYNTVSSNTIICPEDPAKMQQDATLLALPDYIYKSGSSVNSSFGRTSGIGFLDPGYTIGNDMHFRALSTKVNEENGKKTRSLIAVGVHEPIRNGSYNPYNDPVEDLCLDFAHSPISQDNLDSGVIIYRQPSKDYNYVKMSGARFGSGNHNDPLMSKVLGAIPVITIEYHTEDQDSGVFERQFMLGVQVYYSTKTGLWMASSNEASFSILAGVDEFSATKSYSLGTAPMGPQPAYTTTEYIAPIVNVIINDKKIGPVNNTIAGSTMTFQLPTSYYVGVDVRYNRFPYDKFK